VLLSQRRDFHPEAGFTHLSSGGKRCASNAEKKDSLAAALAWRGKEVVRQKNDSSLLLGKKNRQGPCLGGKVPLGTRGREKAPACSLGGGKERGPKWPSQLEEGLRITFRKRRISLPLFCGRGAHSLLLGSPICLSLFPEKEEKEGGSSLRATLPSLNGRRGGKVRLHLHGTWGKERGRAIISNYYPKGERSTSTSTISTRERRGFIHCNFSITLGRRGRKKRNRHYSS